MNDIEVWLKKFLTKFREQYEALSDDQRPRISNLDNFLPPCQMMLFCFEDVSFQWLIVTHDKERKDAEIACHGPVPTYRAVDMLKSVLNDRKWDRKLPEEERQHLFFSKKNPKFRDVLESALLGIIGELRNVPLIEPGPTLIGQKFMLTVGSFVWHVQGNITDLDYNKEVKRIMDYTKKQTNTARDAVERAQTAQPQKQNIKGFGTYFYPPIWVGRRPEKTFREKALGSFFFPKKAAETEYKGSVVVVNEDGFIAIGEGDHVKATKMLNEIMATALLSDLQFLSARELDVVSTEIDPLTFDIRSFGARTMSLRAQLFYDSPFPNQLYAREVKKPSLVGLIQESERISQNPEIADLLVLLLEAHTCLEGSEYMQSFMMSWMIIEKDAFHKWEEYLREKKVTHNRRQKLMNPMLWSVDYVLEALNLAGRSLAGDYAILMGLKSKRNHIMHRGEKVTFEEAERCLNVARKIVQKRCNPPDA